MTFKPKLRSSVKAMEGAQIVLALRVPVCTIKGVAIS